MTFQGMLNLIGGVCFLGLTFLAFHEWIRLADQEYAEKKKANGIAFIMEGPHGRKKH